MKTTPAWIMLILAAATLDLQAQEGERPLRVYDVGPRVPGGERSLQTLPLFSVLDLNGDGMLDPREISRASASLRKLDWNGNGWLTQEELMTPPRPAAEAPLPPPPQIEPERPDGIVIQGGRRPLPPQIEVTPRTPPRQGGVNIQGGRGGQPPQVEVVPRNPGGPNRRGGQGGQGGQPPQSGQGGQGGQGGQPPQGIQGGQNGQPPQNSNVLPPKNQGPGALDAQGRTLRPFRDK